MASCQVLQNVCDLYQKAVYGSAPFHWAIKKVEKEIDRMMYKNT